MLANGRQPCLTVSGLEPDSGLSGLLQFLDGDARHARRNGALCDLVDTVDLFEIFLHPVHELEKRGLDFHPAGPLRGLLACPGDDQTGTVGNRLIVNAGFYRVQPDGVAHQLQNVHDVGCQLIDRLLRPFQLSDLSLAPEFPGQDIIHQLGKRELAVNVGILLIFQQDLVGDDDLAAVGVFLSLPEPLGYFLAVLIPLGNLLLYHGVVMQPCGDHQGLIRVVGILRPVALDDLVVI